MLQAPVKRIKQGAFVADALTGQTVDFETWQFWRWDGGVKVEPTGEGLRVVGTTQEETRAFSGLVSRQLYPPDAVLICEVGVRCEMKQAGRLGAVVHLCNRLVGDDIVTLEIPDNNGEITFGHFEGRVGWFRWYYDQSRKRSFKWFRGAKPAPLLGNERDSFVPVRVSYSEPERLLHASLLNGDAWMEIGEPVELRKIFSSIELKVDAAAKGLDVDVLFRNCRLFPHPARSPVGVYVGSHSNPPAPMAGVVVELIDAHPDRAVCSGTTDEEGLVELQMDPDSVFPVGGRFRLRKGDEVWETPAISAGGVEGIYPGDFYAVNPGGSGDVKRRPRK